MAMQDRVYDGDRYAVSEFSGIGRINEFKVWDKEREIHVGSYTFPESNDEIRERKKEQAVKQAEGLEDGE